MSKVDTEGRVQRKSASDPAVRVAVLVVSVIALSGCGSCEDAAFWARRQAEGIDLCQQTEGCVVPYREVRTLARLQSIREKACAR